MTDDQHIIIYSSHGEFWWLNLETLEQTLFFTLEIGSGYFTPILSQDRQSIYVMHVSENTDRIIRVDLSTLEEQVIFEQEGLRRIFSYSDAQHLIVEYYDGNEPTQSISISDLTLCLLNVVTLECSEIFTFDMQFRFLNAADHYWIGEGILFTSGTFNSSIVDLNTQDAHFLLGQEWFINAITPIHNTRNLLLVASSSDQDRGLYIYNLDTSEVSSMGYRLDPAPQYYSLSLSINNRYLLYSRSTSGEQRCRYEVIDFQIDEYLPVNNQIGNCYDAHWLPNQNAFICLRFEGINYTLISVNPQSNTTAELFESKGMINFIVPE